MPPAVICNLTGCDLWSLCLMPRIARWCCTNEIIWYSEELFLKLLRYIHTVSISALINHYNRRHLWKLFTWKVTSRSLTKNGIEPAETFFNSVATPPQSPNVVGLPALTQETHKSATNVQMLIVFMIYQIDTWSCLNMNWISIKMLLTFILDKFDGFCYDSWLSNFSIKHKFTMLASISGNLWSLGWCHFNSDNNGLISHQLTMISKAPSVGQIIKFSLDLLFD